MDLIRYRLTRKSTICLILLLALWLIACRGDQPQLILTTTDSARLSVTQLAASRAETLSVSIRVDNAADLYQLSCRLGFDSTVVRPLTARRGELVDSRAAFVALTNQVDNVPFAFTYHEGEQIPSGSGTLLELEFTVLDPAADPGFMINSDPLYLIARDALGNSVDLAPVASQ